MKPERWRQVDELLEAALECPATERASFLDQACSGDEELRRELESLLISDGEAERFIESPPARVAADLLTDEQPRPATGERIAHYEILSEIGSGGMGEVYLAQDTKLGRKVALKLLPPSLTADAQVRTRFLREAQLASALDHPNICTIHEIGEDSGYHFIAMQHIEGKTLKELIDREPLDPKGLLSIGLQVADALRAAHELGIIHRDIKSSNIMVTPRGQVKVLDFGLAKSIKKASRMSEGATGTELTHTGAAMGTPPYMSPEQARGEAVDYRSDVFSFGAVLYEMATGRLPFKEASQAETMNAIINKPHAPAISLNKELPVALSAAIDRALAKHPDDRFQSIEEMIEDLRSCARTIGLTSSSSPDGIVVPYSVPQRRTGFSQLKRRMFRRAPIVTAAIALPLVVAFFLIWVRLSSPAPPPSEIKSLVVLPLENLSSDPAQEYFADGMTDALIGDLAKIGALHVISRTSAMHYKGTKKPLPQIGGELKVDAVVEGTVQRSGDRVQIRAQLIHAATDRHLWVETYERDVRDVLGLQSEIARTIAREIQIKITPAEQSRLAGARPVNRKALDEYLQGYYHLNNRTEESLRKAIEHFQSTIREDPSYAPAYAGLASGYNLLSLVVIGALPPTEARRRAEDAAGKALELDSGLSEAHTALGYVKHYSWDWDAAEQAFTRAIELNPNYAYAHNTYAHYLSTRGRMEEAIAEADRAQELDPLSLTFSVTRGFLLTNARRYDEAIEQLRRVIAIDQNHYMAHWFLAIAYAANRQFDEAIATSEKAVVLSARTPGALGVLGMSYGLAGRKAEANKVLDELLELAPRRYVTPAAVVNVYIGLGDNDQAFFWLEKAYQERSNYMAYLKVFPLVDPLRSDPRFDDLLQRIGLAP